MYINIIFLYSYLAMIKDFYLFQLHYTYFHQSSNTVLFKDVYLRDWLGILADDLVII